MSDFLYQEIILEAARHPQHQGELKDADHVVHELNASCGDTITLHFKVDPKTKQVVALKWLGQGCIISQAAMSELSAKILSEKLTLKQIQTLTEKDVAALLGIDEISPGRLKCLTLGLTAFGRVQ